MSLEGKSPDEIAALAQLADSVLSDPKTRTVFQRQLKIANPGVSLPEIDNLDMVANAVRPHIEKIGVLETKIAQSEAQTSAQREAEARFEALKDDGVIRTRKEFEELVQYANKSGFQTTDAGLRIAVSHRAAETTLATPTPMPGAGPEFSKDNEAYRDFFKNPKAAATAVATDMINDFKSGKLKIQPLTAAH